LPSDFISRKQAQTIFRAFDFAKNIGTPLNTYVVINLNGVHYNAADAVMQKIRNKCRVWMKRQLKMRGKPDLPPTYVTVAECPNGTDVHVNWVVHIPEPLQDAFKRQVPKWVRKAQGVAPRDYDIDVQPVEIETDKSLAKYVLKGVDPAFVAHFHLEQYAAPQGPIGGRRAAVSMSLNKAAREKAGFIPKRDRNNWRKKSQALAA